MCRVLERIIKKNEDVVKVNSNINIQKVKRHNRTIAGAESHLSRRLITDGLAGRHDEEEGVLEASG